MTTQNCTCRPTVYYSAAEATEIRTSFEPKPRPTLCERIAKTINKLFTRGPKITPRPRERSFTIITPSNSSASTGRTSSSSSEQISGSFNRPGVVSISLAESILSDIKFYATTTMSDDFEKEMIDTILSGCQSLSASDKEDLLKELTPTDNRFINLIIAALIAGQADQGAGIGC